jgi:hypothetical protein
MLCHYLTDANIIRHTPIERALAIAQAMTPSPLRSFKPTKIMLKVRPPIATLPRYLQSNTDSHQEKERMMEKWYSDYPGGDEVTTLGAMK